MNKVKLYKDFLNEASLSKVHKAAKKGSYPVTIVVWEWTDSTTNRGKVVKQELVKTPQAVPAAFSELQKQYPDATISIESSTGKELFSESVNEATDVWHSVKHKYNYDHEGLTTIDGTPLTNGMSIKQLIKLWKNDEKLEKKIGGSPDGSLVNYYAKQSYELAVLLHKKFKLDFTVDFYRTAWNYGGHISPSYHLKGPWESRKAPIRINSGRAGSSGGCQFGGVLDGLDIRESGFRGDKIESGTHYSWSIRAAEEFDEFFGIISISFKKAFEMPMTARNMVSLGKSYAKLHKAWMKIWGTGGKLDKAYNKFADLRPRRNFDITYGRPELFPKYVKWYIDLPRSFRHPDEYGGQDNWSDEKWEVDGAQEEVSSIITNFCRKHGIDDWISADK